MFLKRKLWPGATRVLVQNGIYEVFTEKLIAAVAAQLKLGGGTDQNATTGPLINEKAAADVDRLVQDSIAMGARIALGGKRSELGSCFYEPTVMVDVNNDMPVAKEEIFGPIVPISRFEAELFLSPPARRRLRIPLRSPAPIPVAVVSSLLMVAFMGGLI